MKTKSIISFLIMAFAMVSLAACSNEETVGGGEGTSTGFAVSLSNLQYAKTGGETELYVRSTGTPSVTTDASWLSVTEQTVTSTTSHKYIVKADANVANDDRTATINVSAGSESKFITVTQDATEGLIILSDKTVNMDAKGGTVTVKLKANAAYTQTIGSDWIVENVSRANMTEYTHSYTVASNISAARSTTISFTLQVDDSKTITEAVTVNQVAGKTEADMSKTAMDIAKLMYPGWNLGNTLEGGNSENCWKNAGVSTETAWQSTKTTQAVIDAVKAAGFKSVRIPCAWVMGHVTDAGQCTIDEAWMARVQEVVDYCIKDGLYVIINQHWDGGWIEHNGFTASTDIEDTKQKLAKIWTQIANHFKEYDEHLIFAGMNEPGVGSGDGKLVGVAELSSRIAEYEQTFIDAVRATGGNNALRVLVVQGPNTNIDNFCDNNYMSKIKDSVSERLMVEVHFYDPYQFTDMAQDADWGKVYYYWGNGNVGNADRTAPSSFGEEYVETQMAKMKTQFFDKGYPVVIGEFGASQRFAVGQDAVHDESIKAYYKAVSKSAVENGCVPIAWDVNQSDGLGMTLFNRSTLKVSNENMVKSIQEGITSAVWPK